MRLAYLDFEFNGTAERKLNLVSVAAHCTDDKILSYKRTYWLYGGKNHAELKRFIRKLIAEKYVFVSYSIEAEFRAILSLFADDDRAWLPDVRAIDLYLEYRCLLNHWHAFSYGQQYIDGRVLKTTPPPNKWDRVEYEADEDEGGDVAHHKPSYSLAAATYKLLGVIIDTDEKTAVRDVIIRGNPDEITAASERILKYNESDIHYLPRLLTKFCHVFKQHGVPMDDWLRAAMLRGDYAVRTARMTELGYPVNLEKLKNFQSNIHAVVAEAVKDCLAENPASFRFDKKTSKYVCNVKSIRNWVAAQVVEDRLPHWRKTSRDQLSISKDAFGDWYDSTSTGFAGAYCRYVKTKQSLNGFLPSSPTAGGKRKRGVFADYVGSDSRVRPYFGIYGSQSSRSQPGAVGFIPLKAHWMRNFIEAPAGRALAGIDYASQEFLIAAVISQDSAMMAAYESGDVYMTFAKDAGLIRATDAPEKQKKMRNFCKALVLGMSYDMSARGLAPRLSKLSGETVTEDDAQRYIDMFFEIYNAYAEWKQEINQDYYGHYMPEVGADGLETGRMVREEGGGRLDLPDGWIMWGDNDNARSVGNFPVQGHGAVIMREAVRLAQNENIDVVYTLHDALYIEYPSFDVFHVERLKACMGRAFETVMSRYGRTIPIRLEGETWSRDYVDATKVKPVDGVVVLPEYVDDKGRADLEKYRKFLTSQHIS